jgi:hypothetical protein
MVIIDSVGYVEERVELCFWLYEQAMLSGRSLVMGGCSEKGDVTQVLEQEAELLLKLENDVGGHGKISIKGGKSQSSVLWKNVNSRI